MRQSNITAYLITLTTVFELLFKICGQNYGEFVRSPFHMTILLELGFHNYCGWYGPHCPRTIHVTNVFILLKYGKEWIVMHHFMIEDHPNLCTRVHRIPCEYKHVYNSWAE